MVSYGRTIRSSLKVIVKLFCTLRSGGISDFDATFGSMLRILVPKQGGEGALRVV